MSGYLKGIGWIAAGLFGLLALPAQAASFDCAKAQSKVEHLICDNPEISKLDEELSAAYKAALQDAKQADSIKQAQKLWMKERNGCEDAGCVKRAYEARLLSLTTTHTPTDGGVAAKQNVTPAIAQLDDELGKVYQDVLNKANEEQKQNLMAEQKHWLEHTRHVCEKETCFKHAYWSRLAELRTFFEPHSPLYKKESDKADAIKQVLATAPLYPMYDTPLCRQIFDDLKQMKDIRFVDPVVQTQSYEDPALDPWKQQCKSEQPIHFNYVCDGRFSVLYKEDIPELMKNVSAECGAGYGLPPFKLFELPLLQSSGEKHYVFYSDDDYGPMNQDWSKPHAGGGSKAGFNILTFPGCKLQGSFSTRGGVRNGPNYNSVIANRGQFFLMNLYKEYGDSSFRLDIEPVIQKPISVCRWSSVKPNTSKQGSN